jgi:hypothetical protein
LTKLFLSYPSYMSEIPRALPTDGLDEFGKCKAGYKPKSFKKQIRLEKFLIPSGVVIIACHACGTLEDAFSHSKEVALTSTIAFRPSDPSAIISPLSDPKAKKAHEVWTSLAPLDEFHRYAKGSETLRQARRLSVIAKAGAEYRPIGDIADFATCIRWLSRNWLDPSALEYWTRVPFGNLMTMESCLEPILRLTPEPLVAPGTSLAAASPARAAPPAMPTPPTGRDPDWKGYAAQVLKKYDDLVASASQVRAVVRTVRSACTNIGTALLVPRALAGLYDLLVSLDEETTARLGFMAVRVDDKLERCRVEGCLKAVICAWVINGQDVEIQADLAGRKMKAKTMEEFFDSLFSFPLDVKIDIANLLKLAVQWMVLSDWAGSIGPRVTPIPDACLRRIEVLRAFRRHLVASAAAMSNLAFGASAGSKDKGEAVTGSWAWWKMFEAGTLSSIMTILSAPRVLPSKPTTVAKNKVSLVSDEGDELRAPAAASVLGALGDSIHRGLAWSGALADSSQTAAYPSPANSAGAGGAGRASRVPAKPPLVLQDIKCPSCPDVFTPNNARQVRCSACSKRVRGERETQRVAARAAKVSGAGPPSGTPTPPAALATASAAALASQKAAQSGGGGGKGTGPNKVRRTATVATPGGKKGGKSKPESE